MMEFNEFKRIVEQKRIRNPFWFMNHQEPQASAAEIEAVERELAVKLPLEYKLFLMEYGGGPFAFVDLLTVSLEEEWSLVEYNRTRDCLSKIFLAISDDHAGGRYGFLVHDGVCHSPVAYWDHETERGEMEIKFNDLFSYIYEMGLTVC